jgi:hypothetical protein
MIGKTKRKSLPKAALQFKLMIVDQAAISRVRTAKYFKLK